MKPVRKKKRGQPSLPSVPVIPSGARVVHVFVDAAYFPEQRIGGYGGVLYGVGESPVWFHAICDGEHDVTCLEVGAILAGVRQAAMLRASLPPSPVYVWIRSDSRSAVAGVLGVRRCRSITVRQRAAFFRWSHMAGARVSVTAIPRGENKTVDRYINAKIRAYARARQEGQS